MRSLKIVPIGMAAIIRFLPSNAGADILIKKTGFLKMVEER